MKNYWIYILLFVGLSISSCEKEITVDLPYVEPKLVVDGRIEEGNNPFILLTKTTGYFDPTDLNTVAASFVNDATITISDGTTTNSMIKICSDNLTPEQRAQVSENLGVDSNLLKNYNICGYTDLMIGEAGKTYTITITWQGKQYVSATKILNAIPLDSTWFKIENGLDSLGFIWATLTDPPSAGNAYIWAAQRMNKYTYGDRIGQQKDNTFKEPRGSVFNDQFFNGLTFDFAYDRARGNNDLEDEVAPERGYFKRGDTVAIRFGVIDQAVYTFKDQATTQASSNGSPFASPLNIPSNVSNGALGLWAGYGYSYDTVICNP